MGAVNLENPAGFMLIGLANTPYLVRPHIKISIHFCPDLGHKEIAKSYSQNKTSSFKKVLYGDERSTFHKRLSGLRGVPIGFLIFYKKFKRGKLVIFTVQKQIKM